MINMVVLLHARDLRKLREFEARVMPILRAHGGELMLAFEPEGCQSTAPDEVHVLRFPTRDALNAYRSDSRLAALAGLREAAIRDTEVYLSPSALAY